MKLATLGNRARRALRGGSRGVTLIEALVAMVLVAIIAVAFLGALTTAARSAALADIRTTAESLARSELERAKEPHYEAYLVDDPPSYTKAAEESSDHPGYYIWVTAFPIDPETGGILVDPETGQFLDGYDEDLGIQEVTVTVNHHPTGDALTLTGYKLDR